MRLAALRYSVVAISAAGLVVAALPAAHAEATHTSRTVGDKCLIGTWAANHGRATTDWDGHTVVMRAGGGDNEHIASSGFDHDNWRHSQPIVGKFGGHALTERIRGMNHLRLHAAKVGHHRELTVTERGWSLDSTNRFVYRGQHVPGYLAQIGVRSVRYRCNATTLTLMGPKGHVIGTETRLSRKP